MYDKIEAEKKARSAVSECISEKVRAGCDQQQAIAMCINMHEKEIKEAGLSEKDFIDKPMLMSEGTEATRPDTGTPGHYAELDESEELPEHLRAPGKRKVSEIDTLLSQP